MPTPREAPGRISAGRNRSSSDILAFRFVRLDTSEAPDGVETASAATDNLHGVSMAAIPDGTNGDIVLTGLAKVTAGAAVAVGVRVTSDATGRAVAGTPGAGVANGGTTKTAAANADDIIEVELAGPGALLPAS